MPNQNAIMPLELCTATHKTSFQKTFNFSHGPGYGIYEAIHSKYDFDMVSKIGVLIRIGVWWSTRVSVS